MGFDIRSVIAVAAIIALLGIYGVSATLTAINLDHKVKELQDTVKREQVSAKTNDTADAAYINASEAQCASQIARAVAVSKIKPTVAVKGGVKDENGCPICDCATISLYDIKTVK